ncbi:unnamed protein product [Lactuca virosa]|uniref:Non-specific lipid-transfer protein n=1 Tax=Lactuca virosa TaxID=75947 RepID=A0AAU9M124_9ASTR|nr:unnamed protein product [Lactuca virosa]
MKGVVIVMLAMLAMVQFLVQPSEALSCTDVDLLLGPCLNYLKFGGTPPQDCCKGLERLEATVTTQVDRQAACNCCKIAARTFQIREDTASKLPDICGVKISIHIDPNVDCSTVSLYQSYK